jgi:hypothetical protein
MNYLVIQRTREFGIRLSVGATQSDVLRLFEEHSRFAGKFGNKSMHSALQHRIPNSCERNGKRLIDGQPTGKRSSAF